MSAGGAALIYESLEQLEPEEVVEFVESLGEDERRWLLDPLFDWESGFARDAQKEPLGDWRVWLINAGRGYGKTRTGAEWIRKQVEMGLAKRIALVGRTSSDVRDVMVEGESGILAISPPWMMPEYQPSKRRLTWRNADGSVRAIATTYGAEKADLLRGPQHDAAWADELASWRYKEAWDNLMLGLRLGRSPRVVATTTPKPTRLLKDLIARKSTVVSGGSTYENVSNLADAFIEDVLDRFEGTSMGRQELHAEMLEEAEGALWKRKWIDDNRLDDYPELIMLVIPIDPAATSKSTSNETGIVPVGMAPMTVKGETKLHFFVLEDLSGRYTPNGWASKAVEAFYEYDADQIIGEGNNGGEMVETTILNNDDTVPVDMVWASRGKVPRATPVAGLYEQGRVHHIGGEPNPEDRGLRDLEDQLCQWEPATGQESPDRLDSVVWGISYMMPTGRQKKLTTGLDLSGGDLEKTSAWRGA